MHLEDLADPDAERARPAVPARTAAREVTARSRSFLARDGWLRLAERTLGAWASTVRVALLILAGIAGVIVLIGVTFGFGGALLGSVLGLLIYLIGLLMRGSGRPSR